MQQKQQKVYQELARRLVAYKNCIETDNKEWEEKHLEQLVRLVNERLPIGAGFDGETELDYVKSNANKLVFHSSYHAMDENGFYTRWYDFTVIVNPSLTHGFDLRIKGDKMSSFLKEYILDAYSEALEEEL